MPLSSLVTPETPLCETISYPAVLPYCWVGLLCEWWQEGWRSIALPKASPPLVCLVAFCLTWNKVTGGMLYPACPPWPAPATWGQHATGLQDKLPNGLQLAVRHGLKAQSVGLSAGQGLLRLSRRHLHLPS